MATSGFGRLDVVVTAAGVVRTAPLEEIDEASWDEMVATAICPGLVATPMVGRTEDDPEIISVDDVVRQCAGSSPFVRSSRCGMSSSSGRWRSAPLPADRAVVELDGRAIVLFRRGEQVFAVDAACPHAGNPLVDGELLGPTLVCAYHGWRFDLETGACLHGEAPLRRYATEVRAGEVWIDLADAESA